MSQTKDDGKPERTHKPWRDPSGVTLLPELTPEELAKIHEENKEAVRVIEQSFPGGTEVGSVSSGPLEDMLGEHLPEDIAMARRYIAEASWEKRAAIIEHAAQCEKCRGIQDVVAYTKEE